MILEGWQAKGSLRRWQRVPECSTTGPIAIVTGRGRSRHSATLEADVVRHLYARIGGRIRPLCLQSSKPAKSLVSQTPRGLGAAPFHACTRVAVLECRHTCRTGLPARQSTPAIAFAVGGDVAYLSNKSACLAD